MGVVFVPRVRTVDVRQEGTRVLVIEDGRTILDMPWDGALALARAIHVKGKAAEELAKAAEIIFDQAILQRLGVPLGLTSNPDMQKVACVEAAWNSDLRRWIRSGRAGGIASQAVFGVPRVIKHKK